MENQKYKCILISDFNINNFSGFLQNNNEFPSVETTVAPFGQVIQVLKDNHLECWRSQPNFAVTWTRPEGCIASFNDILNYKKISLDNVLEEVDEYSSGLLRLLDKVEFAFVPTWVSPSSMRGLGMLDMRTGIGISNTLMRMNLRLSENLEKASGIYLLDAQKWINNAGQKAFNPKLWYLGKIAFSNEVFIDAVKDIKSALRGILGHSKKLVILDLDDTLWGGIVGDVGSENIRLGGHDHIGEAYADFQAALKAFGNRGVLLGIVSKNEEATALEAVDNHPEMVLRLDDFAGWRINWRDKAQNIVDLVSELNLGLQSVVFIDDNPAERARVKEALPEVFVPEWPKDPMLYKNALLSLDCFDMPSISQEDLERKKMYASERLRKNFKVEVGSLDEWLKGLGTKIKIEELNSDNLQRASQLLNKTNQMNLSTRRMTESELVGWTRGSNCKVWTFRVSDKFGEAGLTGIISLEVDTRIGWITDFVLSCRVMGRRIEESMLYKAIQYSKSKGLSEIRARYIPTSKNKPCLDFWKNSGFEFNEQTDCFIWNVSKDYPLPGNIEIISENTLPNNS
jgi:FkbH-like protein